MNTYKLFAVFGASGVGKSTLLEIIKQVCPQATVHRKFTTRTKRPGESSANMLDLEIVKSIDPLLCEVVYKRLSSYYGVKKDLLRQAYENHEMHFIIMRDILAIRKLKVMHPELVVIYIHCDPMKAKKNLKKRDGVSPVEKNLQAQEGVTLKERLNRIQEDFDDFVRNNTLFDHVVVNFQDIETAVKQLGRIIAHYQHEAAQSLVV